MHIQTEIARKTSPFQNPNQDPIEVCMGSPSQPAGARDAPESRKMAASLGIISLILSPQTSDLFGRLQLQVQTSASVYLSRHL